MGSSTKEVVDRYYEGWRGGGWKAGQFDVELLDPDNFSFVGPMETHDDRKSFATSILGMVGPYLEMGTIRRQFIDGDDVCTIYDCRAGEVEMPMAEWIRVRAGRIVSIRLFFDAGRFRT